jgi:hypothetical protein
MNIMPLLAGDGKSWKNCQALKDSFDLLSGAESADLVELYFILPYSFMAPCLIN